MSTLTSTNRFNLSKLFKSSPIYHIKGQSWEEKKIKKFNLECELVFITAQPEGTDSLPETVGRAEIEMFLYSAFNWLCRLIP